MSCLTPSRRRWIILAIIFGALVLNYVDRQIVSILKPTLKSEFGIGRSGYAKLRKRFHRLLREHVSHGGLARGSVRRATYDARGNILRGHSPVWAPD